MVSKCSCIPEMIYELVCINWLLEPGCRINQEEYPRLIFLERVVSAVQA